MKKLCLLSALMLTLLSLTSCRFADYQRAKRDVENEFWPEAIALLEPLADDEQAAALLLEAYEGAFALATRYAQNGDHFLALSTLDTLPDTFDGAAELRALCLLSRDKERYALGCAQLAEKHYEEALATFRAIDADAIPAVADQIRLCEIELSSALDGVYLSDYNRAKAIAATGRFDEALTALAAAAASEYRDSKRLMEQYASAEYRYDVAVSLMRLGMRERAADILERLDYADSAALAQTCRDGE